MPRHAALRPAPALGPWSSGVPRRHATVATATVLAGVLLLAGCAAATPAPEPTPTLPAGVTVAVAQLRADVAPRQAQLRVTNGSDEPITVGDVRVEDPRFDGPATRVFADRVSTIPAGVTVDIRIQLPAADCSAPDDGEGTAVLELVSDSGSAEVTASAPDLLGFVADMHVRDCVLERVTDAATLAFTGFEPSAPGQPATLELTVTPTGEGTVTVIGVEGTNLLSFAGVPPEEDLYPLGLAVRPGDTDAAVVDLPLVPFRCDPHAVQEDKRGTLFDVRVELDGEEGEFELFVGEEMRGDMLTWVAEWCGFGT